MLPREIGAIYERHVVCKKSTRKPSLRLFERHPYQQGRVLQSQGWVVPSHDKKFDQERYVILRTTCFILTLYIMSTRGRIGATTYTAALWERHQGVLAELSRVSATHVVPPLAATKARFYPALRSSISHSAYSDPFIFLGVVLNSTHL